MFALDQKNICQNIVKDQVVKTEYKVIIEDQIWQGLKVIDSN